MAKFGRAEDLPLAVGCSFDQKGEMAQSTVDAPSPPGVHARRRAAFFDAMAQAAPSSVAVVPAAPVALRNNDVDHEYRQDSDFFYLTGFDEPGSVALLDAKERKTTLIVRPRDREREVWDGVRAGVEGAVKDFGADAAFPAAELDERLALAMQDRRRVYYRLGSSRFDERLLAGIDRVRARQRTGIVAPTEIVDPGTILHEMRLRKSSAEVETMRTAARITREAHEPAMARARPGMREYEIEALLLDTFRRHGSERPAYGSIVGSGPNACVLHYRKNDRLHRARRPAAHRCRLRVRLLRERRDADLPRRS